MYCAITNNKGITIFKYISVSELNKYNDSFFAFCDTLKRCLLSMNRKSYFFVIDTLIGSTIIFLSLLVVLNSGTKEWGLTHDYTLAEEYTSFFTDTTLRYLSNELVYNLTASGIITDPDNTVMQQISTFYYYSKYLCNLSDTSCIDGNMSLAHNLVANLSSPLLPEKYGFSYVINDISLGLNTTIFSRNLDWLNTSQVVLVSKRISYVRINSTTLFGPNIVTIKIWT